MDYQREYFLTSLDCFLGKNDYGFTADEHRMQRKRIETVLALDILGIRNPISEIFRHRARFAASYFLPQFIVHSKTRV